MNPEWKKGNEKLIKSSKGEGGEIIRADNGIFAEKVKFYSNLYLSETTEPAAPDFLLNQG